MHYSFKQRGHPLNLLTADPNWAVLFRYIDGTYDCPRYGYRARACAPIALEDVDRVYAAHTPLNEADVYALIGRAGRDRYFAAWSTGGESVDAWEGRCESSLESVLSYLPEYPARVFGVRIERIEYPHAGWEPDCNWTAPNLTRTQVFVDGGLVTQSDEPGFWPSCASGPDDKGRVEVRSVKTLPAPVRRRVVHYRAAWQVSHTACGWLGPGSRSRRLVTCCRCRNTLAFKRKGRRCT